MLIFTSGPATVADPSCIELLRQPPGILDPLKITKLDEDHWVIMGGELSRFRIYFIATHTRAEVKPETVIATSSTTFRATIKLELSAGNTTEHVVDFRSPLGEYSSIESECYGLFNDAFKIQGERFGEKIFPCNLSFILHQADNCPSIPLKVEYIGIAKASGREVKDRLSAGHEKLQVLLAEQNRRPSRRSVSLVLYRPGELESSDLAFSDLIEIMEAALISHFQPKPLNIARLNFPGDSPELCKKILSIGAESVLVRVSAPKGALLYSAHTEEGDEHVIHRVIPSPETPATPPFS